MQKGELVLIMQYQYFNKSKIELGKYDADNETFLLKNDFGEYVLNVPIDEAKQFKSEFIQRVYKSSFFYTPYTPNEPYFDRKMG